MNKKNFQLLGIYYDDFSRDFVYQNKNLKPFNQELLMELFQIIIKKPEFRGKGLHPIKIIRLEGLQPIYFDGEFHKPGYYQTDDIVLIHDLIRICNYNTAEDYISSILDLLSKNGIIYSNFRIRVWSHELSNVIYHGYKQEGDAYKILNDRLNATRTYLWKGKLYHLPPLIKK